MKKCNWQGVIFSCAIFCLMIGGHLGCSRKDNSDNGLSSTENQSAELIEFSQYEVSENDSGEFTNVIVEFEKLPPSPEIGSKILRKYFEQTKAKRPDRTIYATASGPGGSKLSHRFYGGDLYFEPETQTEYVLNDTSRASVKDFAGYAVKVEVHEQWLVKVDVVFPKAPSELQTEKAIDEQVKLERVEGVPIVFKFFVGQKSNPATWRRFETADDDYFGVVYNTHLNRVVPSEFARSKENIELQPGRHLPANSVEECAFVDYLNIWAPWSQSSKTKVLSVNGRVTWFGVFYGQNGKDAAVLTYNKNSDSWNGLGSNGLAITGSRKISDIKSIVDQKGIPWIVSQEAPGLEEDDTESKYFVHTLRGQKWIPIGRPDGFVVDNKQLANLLMFGDTPVLEFIPSKVEKGQPRRHYLKFKDGKWTRAKSLERLIPNDARLLDNNGQTILITKHDTTHRFRVLKNPDAESLPVPKFILKTPEDRRFIHVMLDQGKPLIAIFRGDPKFDNPDDHTTNRFMYRCDVVGTNVKLTAIPWPPYSPFCYRHNQDNEVLGAAFAGGLNDPKTATVYRLTRDLRWQVVAEKPTGNPIWSSWSSSFYLLEDGTPVVTW